MTKTDMQKRLEDMIGVDGGIPYFQAESLMYDIIEDYENRICQNCKHYGDDPEEKGELKCLLLDIAFVETYGCNEWEQK